MKKILLCLVMVLLVVSGCASKEEVSYSYELSVQDVITKLENDETFIVYLGTTNCSACATFAPIAEKMNENYGTQIYHVELDLEKDEDLKNSLLEAMPVTYTPSINIVVDGEIVDNYEGVLEYMDLKEFISEYGCVE